MTSIITRAITLLLGYAYPAFECFKIVEKNKPDVEHLIFWCQYWIILAALTVFERVGDTFISWVPMYSEAKLAFIVYLWYPKTKGTTYVYEAFVKPFVMKHEVDIDRNIHELKTRAGDMIILYGRKSTIYVQARFLDLLQYVAAQSSPARTVPPVHQASQSIRGTNRPHNVAAVAQATQAQTANQIANQQPNSNTQPRSAIPDAAPSDSHQPNEPVPTVPEESAPSSSIVRTETMDTDAAKMETEKQLDSTDQQNIEHAIRMTRNRLRQTGRKPQS
eukprot:TRINITY_DN17625_c0_g1_i1.p1 TRINITY_DN17625_c0_g1~~TRINITY_DN17625_c0_g1_i1.p1  ORF type:complete len:276 (+),score=47.95 TRINITY_DN17625_c0_g1_i1:275-1102(+)